MAEINKNNNKNLINNNGTDLPLPDRLLLFDGVCNLCDQAVQFVIRHDPTGKFKFAALQSDYSQEILRQYARSPLQQINNNPLSKNGEKLYSIVLILHGKVYTHSTAILKLMNELGFPWKLLAIFFILPRPIRDHLYNYIASHRYDWYGKKESCMVPTPQLKERFIE